MRTLLKKTLLEHAYVCNILLLNMSGTYCHIYLWIASHPAISLHRIGSRYLRSEHRFRSNKHVLFW